MMRQSIPPVIERLIHEIGVFCSINTDQTELIDFVSLRFEYNRNLWFSKAMWVMQKGIIYPGLFRMPVPMQGIVSTIRNGPFGIN